MTEIENKYISINLNENGRMEYKITWKEEDKATIEKIKESYKYINDLLLKINSENKKIKFILPDSLKSNYRNTYWDSLLLNLKFFTKEYSSINLSNCINAT